MKTKTLGIRVNADTYDELNAIEARSGVSPATIARALVLGFLENYRRTGKIELPLSGHMEFGKEINAALGKEKPKKNLSILEVIE